MSQVYFRNVLYVNGEPVAHAGPGGQANAKEECWVTIAGKKEKQIFTNLALAQDLTGTTTSAFYHGYPLATIKSYTSTSYGDEGSEGGVKSGTKQGKMSFLSASPNVYFEGNPVCFNGNKVILNDKNSEETTWIQPSKAPRALQDVRSDPIEDLTHPKALNIELIRSPEHALTPAKVQQFISVKHESTNHTRYQTIGMFKPIDNQLIWHDSRFRQGRYLVEELYEKSASGTIRIPLGKISAVERDKTEPLMKLVPLSFRRYDDVQGSLEGEKALYPKSYLYIFKDDYLWREVFVNHLGRMLEVDLEEYYLKNNRNPMAELKQGLLLPIEDEEGEHQFKIAVSKIPWTWEYIYKLGGVDPTDRRFKEQYRYLGKPDQAIIDKRFQKIDIQGLIHQGESCMTVPQSQTEADLIVQHQGCLPPQSSRQWMIEEEYLNLSPGQTTLKNNLYWRAALSDEIPDFDQLDEYKWQASQITGGAVLLIHDPLGRLQALAKLCRQRQEDFQQYVKGKGELYTLAVMVGQMKEVLSRDEYLEVTQEGEREALVRQYEEKQDALKSLLFLSSINLTKWFEASHAQGQWLDFLYVPQKEYEQSVAVESFQALISDAFYAFNMSPEGRQYLREQFECENQDVMMLLDVTTRFSFLGANLRLSSDLGSVLATALKPNANSLEKLVKFLEKSLAAQVNASLSEVVISNQGEFQRGLSHPEIKYSGMIHVGQSHATVVKPEAFVQTTVKTLSLHYEGVQFNELHTLASSTKVQPSPAHQERIHTLALQLEKNQKLRVVFGVLSAFNINLQMSQIDEYKARGELDSQLATILYMGIARDALFISEVGFRYAVLAMPSNSSFGGRIAGGMVQTLGVLGGIFNSFIEFFAFRDAISSNEFIQAGLHFICFSASILTVIATFMVESIMIQLNLLVFMIYLSVNLIKLMIEKNKTQKWILESHWGKTKSGGVLNFIQSQATAKVLPAYSIERFHFMLTAVNLVRLDRADHEQISTDQHLAGLLYKSSPVSRLGLPRAHVLEFTLPFENDCFVKHYFWMSRNDELILLNDTCYTVKRPLSGTGKQSFSITFDQIYFQGDGYQGKIQLECYDQESRVLMGKDAYALYFYPKTNKYNVEKIYYEVKSKYDQPV